MAGIPWTPEEDVIIRRHYPAGGWKACLKRLPCRSKHSIALRARTLGVRYGELEGYINAFQVSKLCGRTPSNVALRAERAGALRRLGGRGHVKRALVREDWALRYVEQCRLHDEAEEARKAGYLPTGEVSRLLGLSRRAVISWAKGERSWLARRFGTPRVVRGVRGVFCFNPADVERVRLALAREQRQARELAPLKALAIEAKRERSGSFYRRAASSERTLLTLVNGRIVRFVDPTTLARPGREVLP